MRPHVDEEKGEHDCDSNTPLVDEHYYQKSPGAASSRYSNTVHWVVHFISVLAVLAVLLRPSREESVLESWNRFNSYTPLEDFVRKHPYVTQPINGSKGYQSEFVGKATDASHQAWQDAMEYGLFSVSKGEVARLGYSDAIAKFPSSEIPGDRYPAVTIGRHQLHCLQFLWSDHHLDYYESRRKFKELYPGRYEGHFEHCIDYLRQRLMCHYDISVVPYQWVRDEQAPVTGAIVNEKCVNWPALKQWLRDAQPQLSEDFVWEVPEGAVPLDERP